MFLKSNLAHFPQWLRKLEISQKTISSFENPRVPTWTPRQSSRFLVKFFRPPQLWLIWTSLLAVNLRRSQKRLFQMQKKKKRATPFLFYQTILPFKKVYIFVFQGTMIYPFLHPRKREKKTKITRKPACSLRPDIPTVQNKDPVEKARTFKTTMMYAIRTQERI